jgi:hypothetical protein
MAQISGRGFWGWIKEETQPKVLLPSLTMGVINGMVEVIFALLLASLLFPGDLSPYFAYGLGISLVPL